MTTLAIFGTYLQGAGLAIVAMISIMTVAFITITSTEKKNKPK